MAAAGEEYLLLLCVILTLVWCVFIWCKQVVCLEYEFSKAGETEVQILRKKAEPNGWHLLNLLYWSQVRIV